MSQISNPVDPTAKKKLGPGCFLGIAVAVLVLFFVGQCSVKMIGYDSKAPKAEQACVSAAMEKFLASSSNVDAQDAEKVSEGLYSVDGTVRVGTHRWSYACQARIAESGSSAITKFTIAQIS